MGSFDLSDRYASLDAKKDPLVEIDAVVPWEEFRPVLDEVWRKPRAGRKPIDTVLMFKTLVQSAIFKLSDDQIEYQVRDRLSFISYPAGHCVAMAREGGSLASAYKSGFRMPKRCGYIAKGWRWQARSRRS